MTNRIVPKSMSVLILLFLLFIPPVVFGEESISPAPPSLTVSQILQNQTEWDGTEITYTGEVIGQTMYEKDHAWINVMDREFNAMGFWLPSTEVRKITYFGRYGCTGDIVTIKGIFNKVCPLHGGDTDIHSDMLLVTKKGSAEKRNTAPYSKMLVCILLLLGIFFVFKFPPKTKKRF